MSNIHAAKTLVMAKCHEKALKAIVDHMEMPPEEIKNTLNFLKMSLNFMVAGLVYSTKDKDLINTMPEHLKELYDELDVQKMITEIEQSSTPKDSDDSEEPDYDDTDEEDL
jgi:hypothetical protein